MRIPNVPSNPIARTDRTSTQGFWSGLPAWRPARLPGGGASSSPSISASADRLATTCRLICLLLIHDIRAISYHLIISLSFSNFTPGEGRGSKGGASRSAGGRLGGPDPAGLRAGLRADWRLLTRWPGGAPCRGPRDSSSPSCRPHDLPGSRGSSDGRRPFGAGLSAALSSAVIDSDPRRRRRGAIALVAHRCLRLDRAVFPIRESCFTTCNPTGRVGRHHRNPCSGRLRCGAICKNAKGLVTQAKVGGDMGNLGGNGRCGFACACQTPFETRGCP